MKTINVYDFTHDKIKKLMKQLPDGLTIADIISSAMRSCLDGTEFNEEIKDCIATFCWEEEIEERSPHQAANKATLELF